MRCACQSCDCWCRFSNASCHVGWLAFLFGMLKILPGWHGLVLAGWICLLVGRMFFLGGLLARVISRRQYRMESTA